jgi:hypothetical protein
MPVIQADGGLMSPDRFLDELYFSFCILFTPPEEDWEGVRDMVLTADIVSTPE